MIRSFKLINANGLIWDLNDVDSLLTEPDNLGFKKKFEHETVGNNYLEISEEVEQPKPKGTINFSSYQKYHDFIKFVQKVPLILKYEIPDIVDPYYLDVEIEELNKGEKEIDNLECDISFLGVSLYYKVVLAENMQTPDIGKKYNYTYPYTYTNSALGTVEIESDTNIESGCKISIFGACTNPTWTHYLNGVVVLNGKVTCSVLTGERLVIDSSKVPYSIKKYDAFMNLIEDCYQHSDFSTKRFVMLKQGLNKISFVSEGSENMNVQVEGRLSYESV